VSKVRRISHHITLLKNRIPHDQIFAKRPPYRYSKPGGNLEDLTDIVWDGLLAVYKPKGWTSADVIRQVKATIEINMRANGHRAPGGGRRHGKGGAMIKVGHGGTLDPIAQGVLVIGIGSGCRVLQSFLEGNKTYRADALMGSSTDTMDSEGKEMETKPFEHVTDESFEEAIASFRGETEQTPPMYSACKKDGTPMYKLARQGKTVQREARKVTLYELKRIDAEKKKLPQFRIELECSKGLYVRVLVNDIGIKCGTLAHMTELTRAKQGKFGLEHCLPAEHITDATAIARHIVWTRNTLEGIPVPSTGALCNLNVQGGEGGAAAGGGGGNAHGGDKETNGPPKKPISEYKVGDEVEGTVQGVTRFGAFVDVGAERDALLHESQMGSRPPRLEAGTKVKVVIISIDERHGKIGLTLPGARKEQQEKEEEEKAVKERTICFSKLPSGLDDEKIKAKMEELFGSVETVQRGGRLPQDVAYVRFTSKEAADKSLASPPSFPGDDDGKAPVLAECKRLPEQLRSRAMQLLLVLDISGKDLDRNAIRSDWKATLHSAAASHGALDAT